MTLLSNREDALDKVAARVHMAGRNFTDDETDLAYEFRTLREETKALVPYKETQQLAINDKFPVNARILHQELEARQDFSSWAKRMVETFDFEEKKDFEVITKFSENSQGGRPSREYSFTTSAAQLICLHTNTDKALRVREEILKGFNKQQEVIKNIQNQPQQLHLVLSKIDSLEEKLGKSFRVLEDKLVNRVTELLDQKLKQANLIVEGEYRTASELSNWLYSIESYTPGASWVGKIIKALGLNTHARVRSWNSYGQMNAPKAQYEYPFNEVSRPLLEAIRDRFTGHLLNK
jgi:phage anti-repressor protein